MIMPHRILMYNTCFFVTDDRCAWAWLFLYQVNVLSEIEKKSCAPTHTLNVEVRKIAQIVMKVSLALTNTFIGGNEKI